jgi:hypothetical protein
MHRGLLLQHVTSDGLPFEMVNADEMVDKNEGWVRRILFATDDVTHFKTESKKAIAEFKYSP